MASNSYNDSTYLSLLQKAQSDIEELYNYQENFNIKLQDKTLDTWGDLTEEIVRVKRK